jgi:hypothetical protein
VVRYGNSTSFEEAWEKGVTEVHERADGTWIADGGKYLSEVHRSEDSRMQGESGQLYLALAPAFFLSDGSIALKYDLVLRGGAVLRAGQEQPEMTPWDIVPYRFVSNGRAHPAGIIEDSRRGGSPVEFDGEVELNGTMLLSLTVKYGSESRCQLLIDPAQGFLPLQTTAWTAGFEGPFRIARITAVRKCSGGRWFPERSVIVTPDAAAGVSVMELIVTELDVDTPPPDEAFKLTVPAGIRLHDGVQIAQPLLVPAPMSVGPGDLSDLLSLVRAQHEVPVVGSDRSPTRVLLIAGCGALLLLISVWIVLRRTGATERTAGSHGA